GATQALARRRERAVGVRAVDRDAIEAVVAQQGGGLVRPRGAAVGAAQHAHAEVDAGGRVLRKGGAVVLHVAFARTGVQHVGIVGADGQGADGQRRLVVAESGPGVAAIAAAPHAAPAGADEERVAVG